ncbi:hypothetical protein K439DRAFT_1638082 [Ramaria rubella]|nr:hypothetical protein K439DRAFT_1638082 [Ramaria rubella]
MAFESQMTPAGTVSGREPLARFPAKALPRNSSSHFCLSHPPTPLASSLHGPMMLSPTWFFNAHGITVAIFLILPNNTNERLPVWSFVSDHALDLMLTSEFQSDQRNMDLIYKTMATHSNTCITTGFIFEKQAHLVFASGGVYSATSLEEPGHSLQFTLFSTPGDLERYNDIKHLDTILNCNPGIQAIINHYLVPQPCTFPVIDSLSISSTGQVILFQTTMADRHPMLVAQASGLLSSCLSPQCLPTLEYHICGSSRKSILSVGNS